MHLAVIEGPQQKERIELRPGQAVTVGRTAQADVIFNQDAYMSGLHFRVRNENGTLLLENFSRTNGTLLNGRRVESAVLAAGDRIMAGQTVFLVVERAAEPAGHLRIGSWRLGRIPEGWEIVEGIGIRLAQEKSFCASMIAVEEPLPGGTSLAEYIEAQKKLILSQLKDAQVSDCRAASLQGADQAVLMDIFSPAPEVGRICQRQLYVVSKGIVGIFTVTLAEQQMEQLRAPLSLVMSNLSFVPS